MSTLPAGLPRLDDPGDAELISAVRAGDVEAYGDLFARHVEAARRLARQLVSAGDVDDLVSEAFAKVLGILQRGGGPDLAFRAYLLTALRRVHVDRIRAGARVTTTDDLTPFDPGVPFRDTAVEGFESSAAARAFASLPERWQLVLWHTEVEGQKPAEVALLLGISPNSVSALAYRAREGLRQAFLSMHVQEVDDDACAWTHGNLGAYVRGGVSRRDAARVEEHLTECRRCTAIYLELTEVNSNLSGLLAPLLLGGLASGYLLSATGGAATKGGLLLLVDRARDFVGSHGSATAVAGVAATAVIGGAVLLALPHDGPGTGGAASGSLVDPAAVPDGDVAPRDRDRGGDRARSAERPAADRGPGPGGTGMPEPGATQPADPTGPGDAPSEPPGPPPGGPSAPPTTEPTTGPTTEPTTEPTPAGADLSVTASATASTPATHEVVVVVTGLPAGGEATLTVAGDPSVVLTLDDRCSGPSVGAGTCTVTGSPATFRFTAVAPQGATLTFTVSGTDDPDPADNQTSVRLGS